MQKRTPEGWLAVAVIVLANLILIILLIILAIWILFKPKEVEVETPIFEEEAIPLEEMLEHDLAFAYAKWEYQLIEEEPEVKYLINVTEEDKALMARVVMSEVGDNRIDLDVKQAVAQTIVNRVRDGRWGTTVEEVVYYPNAYSTANNGEPTPECWDAVESALIYEAFPLDMFYFRENHFHDFGVPYLKLGSTFFTTEKTAWD